MIEESIELNEAVKGEYIINPEYSEVLKKLYEEIKNKKQEMIDYSVSLQEKLKLSVPISLTEAGNAGFIFEVNKKKGDEALRNTNEKFDIVSTKKGYISFVTKKLKELVSEFQALQDEYKIEQDTLILKVLDIVATYFPVIEKASHAISELDALVGFAVASTSSVKSYCRPVITDTGKSLVLVDSRHPLIERMNPQECISNDCTMIRGESNLQIITGPNMGGKTTFIRQISISVLLAHCGCFVPCAKAEIPIVDAIISRVGASDRQLKGISTFMAEMLEAACLLKSATKDSLVIIDELGRGTSTCEGFGLAYAIAEHLAKEICCYTFFATHFHELTTLEHELTNAK
mmetsp:Transcript_39329/g.45147  ORF Transcript_39329/g.45147 Transcript_39329/m.45147 type:complete len:346 (-) Transcript_39329:134-1171(-)